MNWICGARTRFQERDLKRKQDDFFKKKNIEKYQKRQKSVKSNFSKSQDLLFIKTADFLSLNKSSCQKSVKINKIKMNLPKFDKILDPQMTMSPMHIPSKLNLSPSPEQITIECNSNNLHNIERAEDFHFDKTKDSLVSKSTAVFQKHKNYSIFTNNAITSKASETEKKIETPIKSVFMTAEDKNLIINEYAPDYKNGTHLNIPSSERELFSPTIRTKNSNSIIKRNSQYISKQTSKRTFSPIQSESNNTFFFANNQYFPGMEKEIPNKKEGGKLDFEIQCDFNCFLESKQVQIDKSDYMVDKEVQVTPSTIDKVVQTNTVEDEI